MDVPVTRVGIGRRRFLRAGLATAATVGLAACSEQEFVARPITADRPSLTFGEPRGEGKMDKSLLVAYATRTGSTVGVASAIGETLGRRGFSVDVKPILDNPPLDGYKAVVVGSAVNGGKWLPEAEEFVKSHQQALGGVPTALFCVHIMNLGDDERSRQNRLAYLNAVRPFVKPVDEAWFAGLGPDTAPSGIAGWFYRMFGGSDVTGDQRDWAKIGAWAESLGEALQRA
jgi:menaquinone-dependent protoporphyrinogen oxidase